MPLSLEERGAKNRKQIQNHGQIFPALATPIIKVATEVLALNARAWGKLAQYFVMLAGMREGGGTRFLTFAGMRAQNTNLLLNFSND